MAHSRLLTSRNMTLISLASLSSGYFILKSKALADKQRARAEGDYAVTVDRSGGGI